MKWNITYKIWDRRSYNESIALIIDQVAKEFTNLIHAELPLKCHTIVVVNDLYWDHRIYWPLNHDYYKIGLNTGESTFCMAAYQFAHEMAHIYCDPRTINWLIEVIAHMTSFYMLDLFAVKWEEKPPEKVEERAFENFRECKLGFMREAFQKVDLVQNQVSGNWIKKETRKLQETSRLGNRVLYNIIALDLLPMFQENHDLWNILPLLGKCSLPPPPEDPNDLSTNNNTVPDFEKLKKQSPYHLKSEVEALIDKIWNGMGSENSLYRESTYSI